ncbi:unnamed protein product, partial [Effrenium voratum]
MAKRGHLQSEAGPQFLVLRPGVLRIFPTEKGKRSRQAEHSVQLLRAEAVALDPQCLQLQTRVPCEGKYFFHGSEEEIKEWTDALAQNIAETKTRFERYLKVITEGSTVYKRLQRS